MSVYSFLTVQGQTALNKAMTSGTTVNLTKFKVGTSTVPHTTADTDLFSPVYTGSFTGKAIKPIDMNLSVIDCVIPYTSGGYTITEVGLYFTEKVAGVNVDKLFAIVEYPATFKSVGTNYPLTLIVQTGTNSSDSVSITVPNYQFATISYVDVAKHATNPDMVRPMTNDSVYITPKWLETFLANSGGMNAATATATSWSSDISSALSPSLIYIEDASTQVVNGESKKFVMGDWLIKFTDPNTGVDEFTPVKRSTTQYYPATVSPFNIPIEGLATGIICTVTNTTGSNVTINLPAALSFVNGSTSSTLKPDESITITKINSSSIVALIGLYSLPTATNIPGFTNYQDSSMANIDASISSAAFSTILTNAPLGCVMVVINPGLQTINTEDYYLNFGDVVLKDPSGNITVQRQYSTYYTTTNSVTYHIQPYEISDGLLFSIRNTMSSAISTVNLPAGLVFSDGLSTSYRLRASSTLTLFKSPGTNIAVIINEDCDIDPVAAPSVLGEVYSMYNSGIDASTSVGSFSLTLSTIPNSTLLSVISSGTHIIGGTSYDLVAGDIILKNNQGSFKVFQSGFTWKYLSVLSDTLLLSSQILSREFLTVENSSAKTVEVSLPAGYSFTKNTNYYPQTSKYYLSPRQNVTLSLQDSVTKKVSIISNQGNNLAIAAKPASTGVGHPDNGIILYSTDRLPGKAQYLISNTPNLNYQLVESSVGYDFQGFSLLGVSSVTSAGGYPEDGILLYDQSSAGGTSALLLGDLGTCYDCTYAGGLTSNWALLTAKEVSSGFNNTPVGGLLLCSSSATIGFGAILLGNDGNAYKITL